MIKGVKSIVISVTKCLLFFVPKLISSTPNLKVINNELIVVVINNNGAQLFFNESVINHERRFERV